MSQRKILKKRIGAKLIQKRWQRKDFLNFIKNFLEERRIKINRLVLFGSFAKNTMTADSDVDVAVVSSDFSGKDIFERAQMLRGLDWALVEHFSLPFDIVPISLEEWNRSSSAVVTFAQSVKD